MHKALIILIFKIIFKFIILVIYILERKILLHEFLSIRRKIIINDMHNLVIRTCLSSDRFT